MIDYFWLKVVVQQGCDFASAGSLYSCKYCEGGCSLSEHSDVVWFHGWVKVMVRTRDPDAFTTGPRIWRRSGASNWSRDIQRDLFICLNANLHPWNHVRCADLKLDQIMNFKYHTRKHIRHCICNLENTTVMVQYTICIATNGLDNQEYEIKTCDRIFTSSDFDLIQYRFVLEFNDL